MARQPQPRHPPEPTAHFTRNRVVVIVASLLAMLLAAGLVWLALTARSKSADTSVMLPIREVTFVGDMQRVDASELKRIAGGIKGSMLRTDLNDVKAVIKQVRWVRNADVRRRFPATLEVSVEEHQPFAKWKTADAEQGGLVNTYGDVFEADLDQPLPTLSGPPGSAKEVLASYTAFKLQLAAIGISPTEVALSARRAWQIRLDNGALLQLGRSEAGARLARYVRAYPAIPSLRIANTRVDMRYQSGLAIKVTTDSNAKSAKKTVAKS